MLFDSLKLPLAIFCLLNLASNCICQTETDHGIKFYQWTSAGRTTLESDYSSLSCKDETHFIVHGWTENSFQIEYETCAQNYLTMDSASNIILVDYGVFVNVSYEKAPEIVMTTGNVMGNKIVELINQGYLDIKKIQIFGHSLGTHVSGKAGRVVQTMLGERIARISASDPAGPLFTIPLGGPLKDSLTKDDADFVDITHTTVLIGTIDRLGTADTYVRFIESHQPGCQNISETEESMDEFLFCDHRLARAYFIESILSCAFEAITLCSLSSQFPEKV